MDSPTVPASAVPRNGSATEPQPLARQAMLATLAQDVDKLLDLRDAKRKLDADERALTRRVLEGLTAHGLPSLRADRAIATVGTRTDLTVDPVHFVETVGLATAAPALRVLIEKARLVLGSDTLSAIGETATTTTLRVDPVRA
jgi:hypothetical protein